MEEKTSMPLLPNNHENVLNFTRNQVVGNKIKMLFSHYIIITNYASMNIHVFLDYSCACLWCTCVPTSVGNSGVISPAGVQLEIKPNFSKVFLYSQQFLQFPVFNIIVTITILIFIILLCVWHHVFNLHFLDYWWGWTSFHYWPRKLNCDM